MSSGDDYFPVYYCCDSSHHILLCSLHYVLSVRCFEKHMAIMMELYDYEDYEINNNTSIIVFKILSFTQPQTRNLQLNFCQCQNSGNFASTSSLEPEIHCYMTRQHLIYLYRQLTYVLFSLCSNHTTPFRPKFLSIQREYVVISLFFKNTKLCNSSNKIIVDNNNVYLDKSNFIKFRWLR